MEQTAEVICSIDDDTTVFIVTHDPELIVRCCTHVLHLERGEVEEFYSLTAENAKDFCEFFGFAEALKHLNRLHNCQ